MGLTVQGSTVGKTGEVQGFTVQRFNGLKGRAGFSVKIEGFGVQEKRNWPE
jgi:hypothetical protein